MDSPVLLAKVHIAETINRTELLLRWMEIARVREFHLALKELFKQLEVIKEIESREKVKGTGKRT